MHTKRLLLMAAAVNLVLAAAACAADEAILDFAGDVTVAPDGELTVTETIRVRAQGHVIKRGIYRDFPTEYVGRWGLRHTVSFKVVGVTRDGKTEPWRLESTSEGVRVYIGHKAVLLPHGEHTYVLTYGTGRQLGFFDDHDELYWNVTGNYWSLPIEQASAVVHLPAGVPERDVRVEAYTGPVGTRGRDYAADVAGSAATFRTTRRLDPGDGLTVVVGWPKGLVAEPTPESRRRQLIRDNLVIPVGTVGVLVVGLYFLVAWWRVGRDPPRGLVVPQTEAPRGVSPAAARYLWRMKFDHQCFAAALLDMAVKGYLAIEQANDTYRLVRDESSADGNVLSEDESAAAAKLLRSRKDRADVTLSSENHSRISKALTAQKEALSESYGGLFRLNRPAFFVGLGLSAAAVIAAALASVLGADLSRLPPVAFLSFWLSGWSVGVFFLVWQVVRNWRDVVRARRIGGKAVKLPGAVFISLFAIPFVGAEVVVLVMLAAMTSLWVVPLAVVLGALCLVFVHLLKAPTPEGRTLLDHLEGYRLYLAQADPGRLAAAEAPARTPEVFECHLPYAVALDVEYRWTAAFDDVLRAAAQPETEDEEPPERPLWYQPVWYRGAGDGLAIGDFSSSIGSSLAGAVSSSASPPGSSSGFSGGGGGGGGGGSSGGGGGGGGGGGW